MASIVAASMQILKYLVDSFLAAVYVKWCLYVNTDNCVLASACMLVHLLGKVACLWCMCDAT